MSFRISRFFGISCTLALSSAVTLSACSSPDGSTPIDMGGTDAGTDGPIMVLDSCSKFAFTVNKHRFHRI